MKTYKKTYKINATPEEVFNSLTNPVAIEIWTGSQVKFIAEPNTEFELWDGDISGNNIEIVKDKKIVQEWYFGDNLAKSIVSINLFPKGNSTIAELEHSNIPDEEFDDIAEGWDNYYWNAIKEFFK